MIGFIADIEFVWGFQARIIGLSKTSPSFYYPPPTTFLGAIAEVIAKENNIGEYAGKLIINELSANLLAIGFKSINCIPIKYEDINRIIAVKITSGIQYPNPKDLGRSFDSPARGKTILLSLNEESPKIRYFLIFKDKEMQVKDSRLASKIEKIMINEDLFWKIARLGSKESIVCVEDVQKFEGEKIRTLSGKHVITNYAFPTISMERGDEKVRKWENEIYINPFNGSIYTINPDEKEKPKEESGILKRYFYNKDLLIFKVPIAVSLRSPPEYVIILNDGWRAYLVSYKNEQEVVIGK